MKKSTAVPVAATVLAVAALLLLPPRGEYAAAQTPPAQTPPAQTPPAKSAPLYISAVDLQIAPGSMNKFLADLQPDAAALMQELGAREFDSTVTQKDPNHIFIFEVYGNVDAYNAHQKSAAYLKFIGLTMMMYKAYNIRPFSSVSMNLNTAAQPGNGPFFVDEVELDVAPSQFDAFVAAAKDNAAAALKDPGVREINIAVSQNDPHHLLSFEVYDNAAALAAHEATDHFKAYQAATADMVTNRAVTPLTSVQTMTKPQ